MSNFIKPELLAATSDAMIHEFDYENTANQVSDDELGIGTGTRLLLIEESNELEGTAKERNFFLSVRKLYVEHVRKIIAKFPFSDNVISDLGMLDPRNRHKISSIVVVRLLKRFNKTSAEEMDAVLEEWQEFKSLPDDNLPSYESLEHFWSCI